MKYVSSTILAGFVLAYGTSTRGEIKIVSEHISTAEASPRFEFKNVPSRSKQDAAMDAKFAIVDGEKDENGGELSVLHNGKVPTEEDQPAENFFFNAGTKGGRLLIDLGSLINIKEVNSYSWHPDKRAPQVYQLYASYGTAA